MDDLVLMGDPRVAAIPAEECGEELVDLREVPEVDVAEIEDPPSPSYALMRRSVADRLVAAQRALPAGHRLLVVEGYRPYRLQELYFTRHRTRLTDADPTLSATEAHLRASQFVSPPEVAPHVSGAALDLTLVGPDGRPLDLGTEIDASPEDSDGACYFAAPNISDHARQNRGVLAAALAGAGLVNYPTEWWHWSYGDRYWALVTGRPAAIYGPVHGRE